MKGLVEKTDHLGLENRKTTLIEVSGGPLSGEAAVNLDKRIRAADAVHIATSEYNDSAPGVLENAIDWASLLYSDSAWKGKPAAIMGASIGALKTARAQYHLRPMTVFLDMFPVHQPEVMIGNAGERFDEDGWLFDKSSKTLMHQRLENLVEWTVRLRGAPDT